MAVAVDETTGLPLALPAGVGMREIDTRIIEGTAGTGRVEWYTLDGHHVIHVIVDGEPVASLDVAPEEAREVFLHTFTHRAVPDIFATARHRASQGD